MCLLSHHEWGAEFLEATAGGYQGVKEWSMTDCRRIDLYCSNGRVDKFQIIDTGLSVIPASTTFSCACAPKLALFYVGQVDQNGHNIAAEGNSPLVTVTSRLHHSKDGLVGLFTSHGYFLCELRFADGHFVDLKASKLVIPIFEAENLDRKTSVSTNGLLAVADVGSIIVYDLFRQGSPIIQSASHAKVDQLFWASEHVIVTLCGGMLNTIDIEFDKAMSLFCITSPVQIKSFEVINGIIVVLMDEKDANSSLYRISMARRVKTCGHHCSRFAMYECDQKLHLFGCSGQFEIQSLRDPSLSWLIFSPESPMPLKRFMVDSSGKWLFIHDGFQSFSIYSMIDKSIVEYGTDHFDDLSISIKEASWISSDSGEKSPYLAIFITGGMSATGKFVLFDVKRRLVLREALHQQEVERKIITMQDCGDGVLGILLDDGNLQLVQLSNHDGRFAMKLLLKASLSALLPEIILIYSKISFSYSKKYSLLFLMNQDGLYSVTIPDETNTSKEQMEIVANVVYKGTAHDFLIWSISDEQDWLIIEAGRQLVFRQLPFASDDSVIIDQQTRLAAFYPDASFGLGIYLEEGNWPLDAEGMCVRKMVVEQTQSFLVHIIFFMITQRESELEKLFRSLPHTDEFMLVLEVLLAKILITLDKPTQDSVYKRFQQFVSPLILGSNYRRIVHRFLRKIEINDALRIGELLGPLRVLIDKSMADHDYEMALGLLKVIVNDSGSINDEFEKILQKLLAESYSWRNIEAFRGTVQLISYLSLQTRELKETLSSMEYRMIDLRDWPFLAVIYKLGFCKTQKIKEADLSTMVAGAMVHFHTPLNGDREPHTSANDSETIMMLRELGAPIEAAVWSFFCNGDFLVLESAGISAEAVKSLF